MEKEQFIGLVDKYLSGAASDPEKGLVEEYISKFEESGLTTFEAGQDDELKAAMWANIRLRTVTEDTNVIPLFGITRKLFRYVAAAASVILVVGLGIAFYQVIQPHEVAVNTVGKKESDILDSAVIHRETNNSGKDKTIQLSDGSLIVLANKSEITYKQPFFNSRDINLTGKARFNVAKDKKRPFTVTSGDISTTAVGTSFTVKFYHNADDISVSLHEGKVIVKSADSINKKLAGEVHLEPGDELLYSKKTLLATVRHGRPAEKLVKANLRATKNDTIQRPDWYKFNGLPLSEVLNQLSAYYMVDIYYYPSDVENKYFTRKVDRTDSLENILRDISQLNLLTITKNNNSYIVRKKH